MPPHDPDTPVALDASVAHNERIGLVLFFLYLAFYAAFVGLVAFSPSTMRFTLGGVNVAVWYGMTLIVTAIVTAVLYAFLCRTPDDRTPRP